MGRPRFTGALLEGDAVAPYARDFGGVVQCRPHAVVRAADVADVSLAVRHARALGTSVVARGQGHTTRGQCQRDGGVVVDLGALDVVDAPAHDRVRVGAGARWSTVVQRTYAAGLTPPVLTDFVELSVGGTLSVGGVGGQSFAHGLQVDNVLELEVVTGDGELVRCSAERERELFHACLGGLGRFGILVAATLRLVPAPRRVRVRTLPFDELATFLAAQHTLARAGAFDYMVGNFLPPASPQRGAQGWQLGLECVRDVDVPVDVELGALGARLDREEPAKELDWLAYVERLAAMVQAWQASGAWTALHPWMDLFVPHAAATETIELALDGLDRSGLGDGYVMTYPLRGSRHGAALPVLPQGEQLFLFDILPTVMHDERARLDALEQRYARVLQLALDRGATIYPIGYPLGTAALDWSRVLGDRAAELHAIRERHDPAAVFGGDLA